MDMTLLLWGVLFSSIGMGFFIYGRKQRVIVPLLCGLALMIYPYFIPNAIVLVVIGVVLTAVPYFLRL
jgi:predicted membrane protein